MHFASNLTCCLLLLIAPTLPNDSQSSSDLNESPHANNTSTSHKLTGQLTNANGDAIHTKSVTVFLCDGTTGYPIHRQTKSPISPTRNEPQFDQVWYELTDDEGLVSFHAPSPGSYRMVAMSWPGVQGFQGFNSANPPTQAIQLHGIVENVTVPESTPDSAPTAPSNRFEIKPLGSHSLRIDNDPAEPHAILIISLKPTLGDGILGPYGWGKEFCRNWIGVTQMEIPHVTIHGLPDDSDIHVSLINYDNNPGVGAASYRAKQKRGKLRIIATWSNGHKTPPENLLPLVQHLEKHAIQKQFFLNQLDHSHDSSRNTESNTESNTEKNTRRNTSANVINEQLALLKALSENNDAVIDIAEYGKVRLADIIAAFAYIDLQHSVRN